MKLYNTTNGIVIEQNENFYLVKEDWNNFINNDAVLEKATAAITTATSVDKTAMGLRSNVLPQHGRQAGRKQSRRWC
jgi:hypothetical protein